MVDYFSYNLSFTEIQLSNYQIIKFQIKDFQ
jgi:hypothetical protein